MDQERTPRFPQEVENDTTFWDHVKQRPRLQDLVQYHEGLFTNSSHQERMALLSKPLDDDARCTEQAGRREGRFGLKVKIAAR